MRSWGIAIMVAAAMTAGTAEAGKQTSTSYRTFGQWKVETVFEDGKFVLCRGNTKTPTGVIGLINYRTGKWGIAFPDLDFPPGRKFSGMLEIGRASEPVLFTASQPGLRERVVINANTLDALRQGGRVTLNVAGKTYNWYMADAGQAIGAVQDCWVAAKKNGG